MHGQTLIKFSTVIVFTWQCKGEVYTHIFFNIYVAYQ